MQKLKIPRKKFIFLALALCMLITLVAIPTLAASKTFGPYGDSSRYTGSLFPGLTSASASTSSAWAYVQADVTVYVDYDDGNWEYGYNRVGNGPGMVSATAPVSLVNGRKVTGYSSYHTATDSSGTHSVRVYS